MVEFIKNYLIFFTPSTPDFPYENVIEGLLMLGGIYMIIELIILFSSYNEDVGWGLRKSLYFILIIIVSVFLPNLILFVLSLNVLVLSPGPGLLFVIVFHLFYIISNIVLFANDDDYYRGYLNIFGSIKDYVIEEEEYLETIVKYKEKYNKITNQLI